MNVKKILCSVLTAAMVLGAATVPVFADGEPIEETEVAEVEAVEVTAEEPETVAEEAEVAEATEEVAEETEGESTEVPVVLEATETSVEVATLSELKTAITEANSATAPYTIVLTDSITADGSISISGADVTLDLNGNTLDGSVTVPKKPYKGLIHVESGATFTLTDSAAEGAKGKLLNSYSEKTGLNYMYAIYADNSSVNIKDAVVEAVGEAATKFYVYGVYATGSAGTVNVENSSISVTAAPTSSTSSAIALSIEKKEIPSTVTDSVITAHGVRGTVKGIDLVNSNNLTVSGTTVTAENDATGSSTIYSRGIDLGKKCTTATVEECTINATSGKSGTRGIYIDSDATDVTLYNNKITVSCGETNQAAVLYNANSDCFVTLTGDKGVYSIAQGEPFLQNSLVAGGTFNFPITEAQCAAGFAPAEEIGDTGTYGVSTLSETDAAVVVTKNGAEPKYYLYLPTALKENATSDYTVTVKKSPSDTVRVEADDANLVVENGVVINCSKLTVNHGENNGTINMTSTSAKEVITLGGLVNNGTITSAACKITVNAGVVNNGTISAVPGVIMVVNEAIGGTNALEADIYRWDGETNAWVPGAAAELIHEGQSSKYDSLSAAYSAAKSGDEIRILDDLTGIGATTINGKKITIDLNGHTVDTNGSPSNYAGVAFTVRNRGELTVKDSVGGGCISSSANGEMIFVRNNSKFTLLSGKLKSTPDLTPTAQNTGYSAIFVGENNSSRSGKGATNAKVEIKGGEIEAKFYGITIYGTGNAATAPVLEVNGGKINSASAAIIGNGSNTSAHNYSETVIRVTGGEIHSDTTAIYHPQAGKLYIEGGTITGELSGVEIRAGEAEMTGGTVIGNGTPTTVKPNGSGTTTTGAGIAVSQHGTNLKTGLSVTGGTIKGHTAVYENTRAARKDDTSNPPHMEIVSLNIAGGSFEAINGGTNNVDASEDLTHFIEGGTFTAVPESAYIAEGLAPVKNDDNTYSIGDPATKIEVAFIRADDEKPIYDIVLRSSDSNAINRLNSADLSFSFNPTDPTTGEKAPMSYEIRGVEPNEDNVLESVISPVIGESDRYEFHYNFKDENVTGTGPAIKIGQVEFAGYGKIDFRVDDTKGTNAVYATEKIDNIVTDYVVGGSAMGMGELVLNEAVADGEDSDNQSDGIITDVLEPEKSTLTVKVMFPNAVKDQDMEYQDMQAVISGGDLAADITVDFGKDTEVTLADNAYTFTEELTKDRAYTVTVTGAGYRTARYTVVLTGDKELNFWNNDKTNVAEVEVGKPGSAVNNNFLAGEIVKDNNINIFDLSAVVSYFGTDGLSASNHPEYAKYDLNRDGVIDAKDVAYVLVSWGK